MGSLRKVTKMVLPGIVPGGADMAEPKLTRAKPGDLWVDEVYQRNLSERSIALIKKLVASWDWRSFQLPLCVQTKDGLHVVDGQHTAIAAASHPKIDTIPIMVVDAPSVKDRARAFIGRNRDRITVTVNQLHYAAVAAGDDHAVTISQVCERAKITILKHPPGMGMFKPGETMAVSTVSELVNRRGAMRARQVLQVCARAKLAPLSAGVIKSVEVLLTDPKYDGKVDPDRLAVALMTGIAKIEADARKLAAEPGMLGVPLWRALAEILLRRCSRGTRRAA